MSTPDYPLPAPLISATPDWLGGQPVFAGRRVAVRAMFDYLKSDHTLQEFLDAYPSVSRAHAIAVLTIAHTAAVPPLAGTGRP